MLEKEPMGAKILSVDHRETPMGPPNTDLELCVLRENARSCACGMRGCWLRPGKHYSKGFYSWTLLILTKTTSLR